MTSKDAPAGNIRHVGSGEAARIGFLLQRDGRASTVIWVRRTLAIYRRAVLGHRHFAHAVEYRAKFIASYVDFRHWLTANGGFGGHGVAPLHSPD